MKIIIFALLVVCSSQCAEPTLPNRTQLLAKCNELLEIFDALETDLAPLSQERQKNSAE